MVSFLPSCIKLLLSKPSSSVSVCNSVKLLFFTLQGTSLKFSTVTHEGELEPQLRPKHKCVEKLTALRFFFTCYFIEMQTATES